MDENQVIEYADKVLTETQEKNKLLADILLGNATYLKKCDRWVITYKRKSYTFWRDWKNDCWVLRFPNNEIIDFGYKETVVDEILFYIKNN